MRHLTKRQQAVFKKAYRRLKKQTWYRGVCMDRFPSEAACRENPRKAADSVFFETEYWDNW